MNLEYKWTKDLEIGISTVDEEHKEILGLLQFLTLCNGHPTEISDALSILKRYSRNHFKNEEIILEKYNYPDFEIHKKQHEEYRTKLLKLCNEVTQSDKKNLDSILKFISEWWTEHILTSDMKYRLYLRSIGVCSKV